MDADEPKRVFQRLGFSNSNSNNNHRNHKVCFQWRAGKCTRHPCPYLHKELPPAPENKHGTAPYSKKTLGFTDDHSNMQQQRNSNFSNKWGRVPLRSGGVVRKKTDNICNFWIQGSCKFGDRCKYMHSWCTGPFSLLTQLQGHEKVVSGISLPSGSDKLFTGSKDETVRAWDCQSGQCASVINLASEVGCMLSEGPWVFVGLQNGVKAWNVQTATELSLDAPGGQVYAFVVGNDFLFAGTQVGTILAWQYKVPTNSFEPAASLNGHTLAVITLVVGANRIYSGSMDNSIRVWSLETLQCVQTLNEHSSVVMSVLCWDQFLLSCSLDKTIKVWVAAVSGNLEVTYTHNEEHGLLTLCGMHDAESKPVLLCASNDNTIRVYDLPSFSERGRIYSKHEVRTIQIGPGGLFFTGDGTGEVKVWKWVDEATSTA